MHRMLRNQLRRIGIADPAHLPAALAEVAALAAQDGLSAEARGLLSGLERLLGRVDQSYDQFDRDMDLRSRSLMLSSEDLMQANARLQAEGGGPDGGARFLARHRRQPDRRLGRGGARD
ncbi:hypothetical protein [Caenispirillum bisanense]|uniref:hypothetical protein n=1 Tax=Caenispirillum bisanense TaxID=414052 RepID=UPI0031D147AF